MITDHLLKDAENARTGKELASMLQCDIRDITLMIEHARRAGCPIVASLAGEHRGYYIATCKDEVYSYAESLMNRIFEIMKTRGALIKAAEGLPEIRAETEKNKP